MPAFHWVNTNETHRPESKGFMLENKCVVAQYEPKDQINEIKRNDVVFIFQNKIGIIAVGVADGAVIVQDYEGETAEQHLMHLTDFREINLPIPPSTISEIAWREAGIGIYFARTVVHLCSQVGRVLYEMITQAEEPQKRSNERRRAKGSAKKQRS